MWFFRKGQKRDKKEQNICKFGQKCTKVKNILKKGCLMCVAIVCMEQLEYALQMTAIIKWLCPVNFSFGIFSSKDNSVNIIQKMWI